MRILVTGSAGFVGYHLSRRLLAEGHTVTGIDSLSNYYDVRLKEARHAMLQQSTCFKAFIGRLEDMSLLQEAAAHSQAEIVVHLAAQSGVRYSMENPRSFMESNVEGTFNVLEMVKQTAPKHLVMASTSSVYGASDALPLREVDRTDRPLSLYAATKKATEAMAHSYAYLWKVPTTVFRFFNLYGPWGRPDLALFKFVRAGLAGQAIEVYGHGQMERDFTYVDDLVESICRLIVTVPSSDGRRVSDIDSLSPVAPFRIVNIGGGKPVHLMAFIDEIEKCLGTELKKNMMPMQPGDVVRTHASPELLLQLTGYQPSTPVSIGIRAFVDWYKEYYRQ